MTNRSVPPQPQKSNRQAQKQASGRMGAKRPLSCVTYFDATVNVDSFELKKRPDFLPGDESRKASKTRAGGGIRGEVTSFSRQSRNRLLRLLSTLRIIGLQMHFLTLTYPDVYPTRPERWKADFEAFRRRFERLLPDAGGVWRVEYKMRQSGENMGMIAPHWHIILVMPENMSDVAAIHDLRAGWHEIAGSGDENHRTRGLHSTPMKSRRKAYSYVSKYAAKIGDDGDKMPGRRWGIIGTLDTSPGVTVTLSQNEVIQVKRIIRSWLKARGQRQYARTIAKLKPQYGMFVFGAGEETLTQGVLIAIAIIRNARQNA